MTASESHLRLCCHSMQVQNTRFPSRSVLGNNVTNQAGCQATPTQVNTHNKGDTLLSGGSWGALSSGWTIFKEHMALCNTLQRSLIVGHFSSLPPPHSALEQRWEPTGNVKTAAHRYFYAGLNAKTVSPLSASHWGVCSPLRPSRGPDRRLWPPL